MWYSRLAITERRVTYCKFIWYLFPCTIKITKGRFRNMSHFMKYRTNVMIYMLGLQTCPNCAEVPCYDLVLKSLVSNICYLPFFVRSTSEIKLKLCWIFQPIQNGVHFNINFFYVLVCHLDLRNYKRNKNVSTCSTRRSIAATPIWSVDVHSYFISIRCNEHVVGNYTMETMALNGDK